MGNADYLRDMNLIHPRKNFNCKKNLQNKNNTVFFLTETGKIADN